MADHIILSDISRYQKVKNWIGDTISTHPTLTKVVKIALAAIVTIASYYLLSPALSLTVSGLVIALTICNLTNINSKIRQAFQSFYQCINLKFFRCGEYSETTNTETEPTLQSSRLPYHASDPLASPRESPSIIATSTEELDEQ